MIFEERDDRSFSGMRLRRYRWRPERRPKGGVALLHGLGDYLLRYEHVARFFVERGYACEGFDLPGHGKSSGQRGGIPNWDWFTRLLDDVFAQFRKDGGEDGSLGLFAHSMGGYAAFDYLAKRAGLVGFAWLSSPLIRPSSGKPDWLVRLADPAGRWFPRIPIDTGVRARDCVVSGRQEREEAKRDPLKHHRTTLAFGRELLMRESAVWEAARSLRGDLRLLITHGTDDEVCPYLLSRELFTEIPLPGKRFASFEGERHEPLHGAHQGEVFAAVDAWMDEIAGKTPC